MPSRNTKTVVQKIKSEFCCEFCKKDFVTERNLIAHSCEPKRRWMWRDEKYIKLGFIAYQKFYILSMKTRKPKIYADFMKSKYFTSFTKFGKYLQNINAIESNGFMDYVIKTNVKLDQWCEDWVYEAWVREVSKKESPEQAVERNILLMSQWARETDEPWQDFFRKVNPQLATKWIQQGRISPWILYAGFGDSLFSRMSDEQLGMVRDLINPEYWTKKFALNREAVAFIKISLTEAGV
jgi:hypothetical protein